MLTISSLEDEVVDALKARVRRNNRSLEAEVRQAPAERGCRGIVGVSARIG